MGRFKNKPVIWALLAATILWSRSASAQKSYADFFVGTGDNYVVADSFPVDSHAFIDATFDMVKQIYGTKRIQWRGLQDQMIKNGTFRPESALLKDWFDYINTNLDDNLNINEYAVQAAHARGMEIWGRGAIYDWGDNGNTTTTNLGFPSAYESNLRATNPQWEPTDRFGIRRQSGPIELGYAGARQAISDAFTSTAVATGYDGVVLQLYNENYSTRFADEFGFNDPVVQDYQTRYGIDLRRARTLNATQIQNFRNLRGEYTTELLRTMHTQLGAQGIELGMEVNGYTDPSIPSLWLLDSPYPETGIITQEWQKWVDEQTVDELWLRRGVTSTGGIQVYNYAQNSGVAVSAYASNPLNSAFNAAEIKGVTMIGTSSQLAEVVRNGNVPTQGITALTSTDPYKRMKILQQVITGSNTATVAQVTPLVSDANILVRRLALEALGKIGNAQALSTLENALQDPENGIRTGALLGLLKLNASTPTTITKILDAMPLGESPAMLEEARNVLLQMPAATVDPVLVNALTTSPSTEVRKLAARTLFSRIVGTNVPTVLNSYMQAANDPDPYVRFFAIKNQYYESPTDQSLNALVGHMNGTDSVTSNAAADMLGTLLFAGYTTARARETELVQALSNRFAQFGDDSSDPNSDWAYETVGRALFTSTNYFGSQKKGETALRNFMRQRSDRKLSERAWQILFIPNLQAQLNVTTFEASEQAYLRRPRWDSVVAVSDNFNNSASGTLLVDHSQQIGQGWTVEAGTDPNTQDIQNIVSNGGNALRLFRAANSPTSHTVRGRGHLYDASVAELTRVSLKSDWLRQDGDESALLSLDLTDPLNEDPTVFAHTNGNYWVQGANGYFDTSFAIGQDGWETIELVLTWGLSTADKVTGTFDVFLTRDAQNSLGPLSRTLIAGNVPVNPIGLATAMDIVISNQPGGIGDVITYWDNISLRVDPLLDGDFNRDGTVDAADYVVWRDGLGTIYNQSHYTLWKNNFGATSNPPSSAAFGVRNAVPEPPAALLLALGAALTSYVYRSRKHITIS